MNISKINNDLNIEIREAQIKDAKNIIDFYNIVGGETTYLSFGKDEYNVSLEQQEKSIESINSSDNNLMILALKDKEIIGIGTISSNQKKKGKHVGTLGIVITKKYCDLGIGKEMMNYLINWCKENRVTTKISLVTREDNIRATELYKKCGFEVEGILKNETLIGKEYFNLISMGLILV